MSIIKNFEIENSIGSDIPTSRRFSKIIKSNIQTASSDPIILSQRVPSMPMNSFSQMADSTYPETNDFEMEFDDSPSQPQNINEPDIRTIPTDIQHEFNEHFNDLTNAINGLQEARQDVVKSTENQIIELALLVAEKVIQKQIETDPSIITSVVEDTLNKIAGSDRVTFKINPKDADAFHEFQPVLSSRLAGVGKLNIQHDASIEQGGCLIETNLGFIDITIQEKLNLIANTFKKIKQYEY